MARISKEGTLKWARIVTTNDEVPAMLQYKQPSQAAISQFNRDRTREARNGQVDFLTIDVAFIDPLLVDCKQVEYEEEDGTITQLTNQAPDWKSKIYDTWKQALALRFIVGEASLMEEQTKN